MREGVNLQPSGSKLTLDDLDGTALGKDPNRHAHACRGIGG